MDIIRMRRKNTKVMSCDVWYKARLLCQNKRRNVWREWHSVGFNFSFHGNHVVVNGAFSRPNRPVVGIREYDTADTIAARLVAWLSSEGLELLEAQLASLASRRSL